MTNLGKISLAILLSAILVGGGFTFLNFQLFLAPVFAGDDDDDENRGSAGLRDVEVVTVPDILVPVGAEVSETAFCPEGKVALGGGHSVVNLSGVRRVTSTNLVASAPSTDPLTDLPIGWQVTYSANQADNHSLTVYVVCASHNPRGTPKTPHTRHRR